MNPEEYQTLRIVEESHWWHRALRTRVLDLLKRGLNRWGNNRLPAVLDAGCGTGGLIRFLDRQFGSKLRTCGIDRSDLALQLGGKDFPVAQADVCKLPFSSSLFDYVISLDVLYHSKVEDDVDGLRELCRVTKPGGCLLLNLPAHGWLHSSHDVAVHTIRRYTRGGLAFKLRLAGFEIEAIEYWNSFLFVPATIVRIWRKRRRSGPSDLHLLPGPINSFFGLVLALERLTSKYVALPIGLSLLVLARKPHSSET